MALNYFDFRLDREEFTRLASASAACATKPLTLSR